MQYIKKGETQGTSFGANASWFKYPLKGVDVQH